MDQRHARRRATWSRRARADGATIVYTTDDNILDLKIEGAVARWLSPAHQDVVRYLAAEADGVIISTPPLVGQMAAFNRLVLELPNALDERLFEAAGAARGNPRRPAAPSSSATWARRRTTTTSWPWRPRSWKSCA